MSDVEESKEPESKTLRFYHQTGDKFEIKGNNEDAERKQGPILSLALSTLKAEGIRERSHMDTMEGGRSGDLYVLHRRLTTLRDEGCFMGGSCAGNRVAQVYQVVIDSTNGGTQYVSILVKGPQQELEGEWVEKLHEHFAPRHNYLAKGDRAVNREWGLWLDDFVEFEKVMPGR